jgi:hypothetical protein
MAEQPGKVIVAWIDPGSVLGSFMENTISAVVTGALNGVVGGWIRLEHGPSMDLARNKIVERFLQSDGEWLLMVDSDMGFPADLPMRLLATADAEKRPIVGGLCFGMNLEQGVFPTAYWIHEGRFWILGKLPDEPFQVDGTGAAVLMIHRSVFAKTIIDGWPGRWFDRLFYGGEPVGEDLSFCLRCRAAGVPIWIDPTIPIDHYKIHLPLNRASWQAQKEKAE